jgi:hypothetical protein
MWQHVTLAAQLLPYKMPQYTQRQLILLPYPFRKPVSGELPPSVCLVLLGSGTNDLSASINTVHIEIIDIARKQFTKEE